MGIFLVAQRQLTPQSLVESGRISNSSGILWLSLLSASMKKIRSKNRRKSANKIFPIITLWELSVAMETRVPIRSGQNITQPFPTPMMLQNLVGIGLLVVEIIMFESVNICTDGRTHARTDAGSTGIL